MLKITLMRDDVMKIVGNPQRPSCQANFAFVHVNLNKDDFPRANIYLDCIEGYNKTHLWHKHWLRCRGIAVSNIWAELITPGERHTYLLYVWRSQSSHPDLLPWSKRAQMTEDFVLHRFLTAGWRMILPTASFICIQLFYSFFISKVKMFLENWHVLSFLITTINLDQSIGNRKKI